MDDLGGKPHPRDPRPHLQVMNFLSLLLNHTTSLEPPQVGCFLEGDGVFQTDGCSTYDPKV